MNRHTYRVEVVVTERPRSVGPLDLVDYTNPDATYRVMAHNAQRAADLVATYLIDVIDTDEAIAVTGTYPHSGGMQFYRIDPATGNAVKDKDVA